MRSHDYNEKLTKYVLEESNTGLEALIYMFKKDTYRAVEIDAVSYYLDKFPTKCNRKYRLIFFIGLDTGEEFDYNYDFDCSLLADSIMYPENDNELGDTLIDKFNKATDDLNDLYNDIYLEDL